MRVYEKICNGFCKRRNEKLYKQAESGNTGNFEEL